MINKIHLLKWHRKNSQLFKQDVAHLLDIESSNLTRYEKGNSNPTPDIILTYHILFGASLTDLFKPSYSKVCQNIIDRSKTLMDKLQFDPSPKSSNRISCLTQIVNSLNNKMEHEQD